MYWSQNCTGINKLETNFVVLIYQRVLLRSAHFPASTFPETARYSNRQYIYRITTTLIISPKRSRGTRREFPFSFGVTNLWSFLLTRFNYRRHNHFAKSLTTVSVRMLILLLVAERHWRITFRPTYRGDYLHLLFLVWHITGKLI